MDDGALVELEPREVDLARPRILIVDDDSAQVESLHYRLTSQGFDVIEASTGKAGIEKARQSHPDLVLLDLRLPDIDGLEVSAQLCDDPATLDIPVIVVSGMEAPDIIRRARASGSRYYVRKPYDPNALLVLIRQALSDESGW